MSGILATQNNYSKHHGPPSRRLAVNLCPSDHVASATSDSTHPNGYSRESYPSSCWKEAHTQTQYSGYIQPSLYDKSWLEAQARYLPAGFASWEALFTDTEVLESIITSAPSNSKNLLYFTSSVNQILTNHEQLCSVTWEATRANESLARFL